MDRYDADFFACIAVPAPHLVNKCAVKFTKLYIHKNYLFQCKMFQKCGQDTILNEMTLRKSYRLLRIGND